MSAVPSAFLDAPARPKPDKAAMLVALAALFDPSDVIELRSFARGRKRTDAGYFDGEHREALVNAAARLNADGAAVYVTMNRIDPQLLGRYCNRIEQWASDTATDANVIRRRWLLIDLDPVRPKNTAATGPQVEAARDAAEKCYRLLKAEGWPEPLAGESGNGWHLLYPLDLPNDAESAALVKGALAGLAARLDDAAVKVDQSVFNAARITKLYGTVATKGDHTAHAPWRLSALVSTPARGEPVTPDQLRALLPAPVAVPKPTVPAAQAAFDLADHLARLGIDYEQDRHEGRERYRLAHCPFNEAHGKGEAAIFRDAAGKLGFKCQHDSCSGKHWQDVRDLIDGPREVRSGPKVDLSTMLQGIGAARGQNAPAGDYEKDVSLIRASDLAPEPISWLWNGWLAAGKMHILGGAPGTGKTTISMALAATVTTGGRWPDGSRALPGNVVIWSGEDDPADTLIPRLTLSGADLSRVYFIADILEGGERRAFDPASDMESLRRKLGEIGGARLLIVDPVVSAIAGDSHKNAEVRRGLQPLADLAASMRCAVIGITHFSKGTGGRDPVERLTGSLAFGALARVVMVAAKHQEEGEDGRIVRLFCRAKSNLGPDDGGFVYDLHQAELRSHPGVFGSSVLWGDAVEGAARDLLAEADAMVGDGEGGTLADAKRFLADLLANGPMRAGEILKDAEQAGYSKRSIQRAANAIKVERRKDGMRGGWTWRLPPKMPDTPEGAVDAEQESLARLAPSAATSHVEVEI